MQVKHLLLLFFLIGVEAYSKGLKSTIADEVILQIVTDRFKDGNPDNNIPESLSLFGKPVGFDIAKKLYDPNKHKGGLYFGGDLQGIIDMVPAIRNTGISAIWISPHILQSTVLNGEVSAYHGYWGKDWFSMDPHITNKGPSDYELFHKLIETCHKAGIKVVIDLVFNHTGSAAGFPSSYHVSNPEIHEQGRLERQGKFVADFTPGHITAPYLNDSNWFNPIVNEQSLKDYCAHYGISDKNICRDTMLAIYDLPDFNTFHLPYLKYMKDSIDFWISFGIDGMRIDTYRNLPVETLNILLTHASSSFDNKQKRGETSALAEKLIIVGEYYGSIYDNRGAINYAKNVKAGERLVSVLDFPLAFKIRYLFGSRGGANYSAQDLLKYLEGFYNNGEGTDHHISANMTTFFDNHDQELLIHNTWNESPKYRECSPVNNSNMLADKDMQGELLDYKRAINQATAFLLSLKGMPILYYASLAQLQPSCYPFHTEGLCSRPFLNSSIENKLIGDSTLQNTVYNLSKLRRRTWMGKENISYNPVFRHGDFKLLSLPKKDFYSEYVYCKNKGKHTNRYDRNDLTTAFERCTKDNDHCLLYISSQNFKANSKRDTFEINNLRFRPGKYRNLIDGKTVVVKRSVNGGPRVKITIGNYESIILVY